MRIARQAGALHALLGTPSRLGVAAAVAVVLAQAGQTVAAEAPASRPRPSASIILTQSDPARTVSFDIESQPMAEALTKLGEQSGLTIIVESRVTKDIQANALSGRYTPDEALRKLLEPAGLKSEYLDSKTVTVRPASAKDSPESPTTRAEHVEEIVVTGSRLTQSNPDGGPAPVTIIDRSRLEKLGVTNVADALNYVSQQSFSTIEGFSFAGSRVIRLRGLGFGNTVILIDGRRTVTSALQAAGNMFDVNTIPVTAVERIEVLSDSASAVYGADAVGGVVNIVLKKSMSRPELLLSYGGAHDGADERRATLGAGYESDRVKLAMTADYFDRSFLYGRDRAVFANGDFRSIGGLDTRSALSNPANISSQTPANLPGLSSRTAAVPVGSTGVGLTPASFTATAGQQNLESLGQFRSVVPESRRTSAVGSAEVRLTSDLTAFGDVLFAKRDENSVTVPGFLSSRTVPASNAFNPFGVPVAVNYIFEGLGSQQLPSESKLTRGVLGLRGQRGKWDWELSAFHTSETAESVTANNVDTARVNAALASSDPTRALNVFQDGPGGSPELLASLVAAPVILDYRSRATQGAGFVRFPLFNVAAGEVQMVAGAEARSEKLMFSSGRIDADRHSSAAYAEMRVPVLSKSMGVTGASEVTLTAAARYDRYSDFGGKTSPQLGLVWRPFSSLLLRGNVGRSFRAPSLYELFSPRNTNTGLIADPRRGNAQAPVTLVSGGNPDLLPEHARSSSYGFVYTPAWRDTARLAASYWSVHQSERAEVFTSATVLANEAILSDRVERAAPSAADQALGRPGPLVSIDTSTANFGRLDTSGIDLTVSDSYASSIGRWTPQLSVTWVSRYDVVDFPNTPAADRVGVASSQGTIPEFRGALSLGWDYRAFGLNVSGRYTSSYADVDTALRRTGLRVPDMTLVDLQASLDLGEALSATSMSWLADTTLRLGAFNLFDKAPNYSSVNGNGFDASQVDLRQRYLYVSISRRF